MTNPFHTMLQLPSLPRKHNWKVTWGHKVSFHYFHYYWTDACIYLYLMLCAKTATSDLSPSAWDEKTPQICHGIFSSSLTECTDRQLVTTLLPRKDKIVVLQTHESSLHFFSHTFFQVQSFTYRNICMHSNWSTTLLCS